MSALLDETLTCVVEDVFGASAFMLPATDDDQDAGDARGRLVEFGIDFSGPFSGRLLVTIPEHIVEEISANMLGGTTDALAPEQRFDAAMELVNVLCGHLLPAVAGPKPVFDVGAPYLAGPSASASAGAHARAAARVVLESGVVNARLYADDGLPERR